MEVDIFYYAMPSNKPICVSCFAHKIGEIFNKKTVDIYLRFIIAQKLRKLIDSMTLSLNEKCSECGEGLRYFQDGFADRQIINQN